MLAVMRSDDWLDTSGILLGSSCPVPLDRPFTANDAVAWGVSRDRLREMIGLGLVRRVVRGAYAASQCEDSIRTRAQALRLVVAPTSVVCDRTAGWLHGMPILKRGAHLVAPPLDLCSTTESRIGRPEVKASRRSTLKKRDIEQVHGLPVTTALRTAMDLGRKLWKYDAIASLDGALSRGVDQEVLLDEMARFKGQRGVVQLRALAPLADGRSESPGESALRLRWHEAGLPKPEPQFEICDERGTLIYRLDVPLPELRFAAEYDGEEFHSADEDVRNDAERRDDLWHGHGWRVRGFTKHDVYDPRSDLDDQLHAMLVQARREVSRWTP